MSDGELGWVSFRSFFCTSLSGRRRRDSPVAPRMKMEGEGDMMLGWIFWDGGLGCG